MGFLLWGFSYLRVAHVLPIVHNCLRKLHMLHFDFDKGIEFKEQGASQPRNCNELGFPLAAMIVDKRSVRVRYDSNSTTVCTDTASGIIR